MKRHLFNDKVPVFSHAFNTTLCGLRIRYDVQPAGGKCQNCTRVAKSHSRP